MNRRRSGLYRNAYSSAVVDAKREVEAAYLSNFGAWPEFEDKTDNSANKQKDAPIRDLSPQVKTLPDLVRVLPE